MQTMYTHRVQTLAGIEAKAGKRIQMDTNSLPVIVLFETSSLDRRGNNRGKLAGRVPEERKNSGSQNDHIITGRTTGELGPAPFRQVLPL